MDSLQTEREWTQLSRWVIHCEVFIPLWSEPSEALWNEWLHLSPMPGNLFYKPVTTNGRSPIVTVSEDRQKWTVLSSEQRGYTRGGGVAVQGGTISAHSVPGLWLARELYSPVFSWHIHQSRRKALERDVLYNFPCSFIHACIWAEFLWAVPIDFLISFLGQGAFSRVVCSVSPWNFLF